MMQKMQAHRLAAAGQEAFSDQIIGQLFQHGKSDVAMNLFQVKYKADLPSIKNFLLGKGCDTFSAEDVLQDAWEHFIMQLKAGKYQYQGEGSLFRWFFGISRNSFLKNFHARCRNASHLSFCDPQSFLLADVQDIAQVEAAASEDLFEALSACQQKQKQRNLRLVMGHVEGISYANLAKELNFSSPESAKQRCYIVRMGMKRDIQRRLST